MDIHGPLLTRGIPGAREESASPAWLAAPAMNARDTTKVYIYGGLILDVDRNYIGTVTATKHQEKVKDLRAYNRYFSLRFLTETNTHDQNVVVPYSEYFKKNELTI